MTRTLSSLARSVAVAALAMILNGGCATTITVAPSESYVSEIEQELIPREVALDLVRQHFDVKDDSMILLSKRQFKGDQGVIAYDSQWVPISSCVLVFNDPELLRSVTGRNIFSVQCKGPYGTDPLDALVTFSHRPAEDMKSAFALPGRHPWPAGMTVDEMSALNKKLAAAFVSLGMTPAPGGTYDVQQFIINSR